MVAKKVDMTVEQTSWIGQPCSPATSSTTEMQVHITPVSIDDLSRYTDLVAKNADEYVDYVGEGAPFSLRHVYDILQDEKEMDPKRVLQALRRHSQNELVAAYDITFYIGAPLSLLWRFGRGDTGVHIGLAQHQALHFALTPLVWFPSDEDLSTRYPKVMFEFPHRVTRGMSPALHTHVLIANEVRDSDGNPTTIDSQILMDQLPSIAAYYRQSVRHYLSNGCGFEWTPLLPDGTGGSLIDQIEPDMVEGYDRINQEIEGQLDEWYLASGEVLSSREERRKVLDLREAFTASQSSRK